MATNRTAGVRFRVGLAVLVIAAGLVSGIPCRQATAGRILPSPSPASAPSSQDLHALPPTGSGAMLSATAALLLGLNIAFMTHLRRAYVAPRRAPRPRG